MADPQTIDLTASHVNSAYQMSLKFLRQRFQKFNEWEEQYYLRLGKDEEGVYRSKIVVPLSRPVVETYVPRLVGRLPKFKFSTPPGVENPDFTKLENLVKYQFENEIGSTPSEAVMKLRMWVKEACKYGRSSVVFQPMFKDKQYSVRMDLIDNFRYFPAPNKTSLFAGDFELYETEANFADLENAKDSNGQPLYENLEQLKQEIIGKLVDTQMSEQGRPSDSGIQYIERRNQFLGLASGAVAYEKVKVRVFWGLYTETKEEFPSEYLIIIANEKYTIRIKKNDKDFYGGIRPIVPMFFDPEPFHFESVGILEKNEGLQREKNAIRRARMDAKPYRITPMVYLDETKKVKGTSVMFPGKIWRGTGPGGVTFIEPPHNQENLEEEAIIDQNKNELNKISEIMGGQVAVTKQSPLTVLNKTLGGAQLAVGQANIGFNYHVDNIDLAFAQAAGIILHLDRLFMPKRKIKLDRTQEPSAMVKGGMLNKIKSFLGLADKSQIEEIPVDPSDIPKELKIVSVPRSTVAASQSEKLEKIAAIVTFLNQLAIITPETQIQLADMFLSQLEVEEKDVIMQTLQIPQGKQRQAPRIGLNVSSDDPFMAKVLLKSTGLLTPQDEAVVDESSLAQLKSKFQKNGQGAGQGAERAGEAGQIGGGEKQGVGGIPEEPAGGLPV